MSRWKQMTFHESRLASLGYTRIFGMDEAGRGPLAGPVVAAICKLPPKKRFLRLNDSKQMTEKERNLVYFQLTHTPGCEYAIGVASVEEIDRMNILNASLLAMERAYFALKALPDFVLVDGNRLPSIEGKQEALVHGDALSVSIAAASVLAKVYRDRLMETLDQEFPLYGLKNHKGYGTKEHKRALTMWGPSHLHRKSFLREASSNELLLF